MSVMTLMRDRQHVLRASFITIASRLMDLPSRYGFHLLVAYRLGVLNAGLFYIVFSIVGLAAGAGRLGLDRALTREVARAMVQDRPNDARAIIVDVSWKVTGLSVLATVATALCAGPVATHLLRNPAIVEPLIIGALSLAPLSLSLVAGGALLGLMRAGLSQMVYSWLWPGLFCLAALVLPLTTHSALWLMLAATTINAVTGFVLLARFLPGRDPDAAPGRPVPIMGLGLSLFTSELVQLLIASSPTLVLGIVAGEREVGYFALAWRMALILNLLVSAVAAMMSPRFARAHAQGRDDDLRLLSRQALLIVFALGIMPLLILAMGAEPILHLFGPGYGEGAVTLRILLAGQAIAMLSASGPELLGMTGHGDALRRINLVAAFCLMASLAALVPFFGANGAAIATVLTALAITIGASLSIRRWLGFVPLATLRR